MLYNTNNTSTHTKIMSKDNKLRINMTVLLTGCLDI